MKKCLLFTMLMIPMLATATIDTVAFSHSKMGRVKEWLYWLDTFNVAPGETILVEKPIKIADYNTDALYIMKGGSLKVEYMLGPDTNFYHRYSWAWNVDTTCTGTDSVYRTSIIEDEYYSAYIWFRFISIDNNDTLNTEIIYHLKEQ